MQPCRYPGVGVDATGKPARYTSRVTHFQSPCHLQRGHLGDHQHNLTPRLAPARVPSSTREWNRICND